MSAIIVTVEVRFIKTIGIFCLLGLYFFSCTNKEIRYPDKTYPGLTPSIFASNGISISNRFEQNITFSANGSEYYYGTASAKEWWYETILMTTFSNDGNFLTDTVSFVKSFKFEREKFIGEPFVSPDNKKMFFIADLPPDIWVTERNENNKWTSPAKLASPVNSTFAEWNPSVSLKGTLFFASTRTDSGRIYQAELVNNKYENVTLIKGQVNNDDAGDPCIAPDESFLLFSSWRKGGYGGTDIYVSYPNENGEWSVPVNLGPSINTEFEEVGPRISPDGKYLFFHRRDRWQNATYSDIYWVDINVLKHIK